VLIALSEELATAVTVVGDQIDQITVVIIASHIAAAEP
jgi:hypothetical protein